MNTKNIFITFTLIDQLFFFILITKNTNYIYGENSGGYEYNCAYTDSSKDQTINNIIGYNNRIDISTLKPVNKNNILNGIKIKLMNILDTLN